MKYQNLAAFEKHLTGKVPGLSSHFYLVVSPCPYERRQIAEKVFAALPGVTCRVLESAGVEELLLELSSLSLLGGKEGIYLDGIEKWKKPALTKLTEGLFSKSAWHYLILGAGSAQGLKEFYDKGKKELVVCDLSQEKPWDKKERLKLALMAGIRRENKTMSPQAVDLLLEKVGLDLAGVDQEVVKLATYVGERASIGAEDVKALCFGEQEVSLWKRAEALVWQRKGDGEALGDVSDLLGLMACVRGLLQQGLVVATLKAQGFSGGEIAAAVPSLRQGQLEKALGVASVPYFKWGLKALFEVELLAKNSYLPPKLLFEFFLAKWLV